MAKKRLIRFRVEVPVVAVDVYYVMAKNAEQAIDMAYDGDASLDHCLDAETDWDGAVATEEPEED